MKKAACALLACLLLPIFLTGCWDIKTIQDTNYITAIGYDYKDGQFVVYAQMLDFANVSRQEGGKGGQPASVWSGHESGGTVIEAMNRLYQTSQQRVFWGQVSSIVFTERALQRGIPDFWDGLIRFREMRYTQWVYGTKEPIDKIFTVLPFFHQSPIGSILHQPEDIYRQHSYIRPLRLQKAVAVYREPGGTLLLPSLGIAKTVWKQNRKDDPKLEVNGLFLVSKKRPNVWISDEHLQGLRWLDRDTKRSNVMLQLDGAPVASVSIEQPQAEVRPSLTADGEPTYAINVRGKFTVSELIDPIDEVRVEKEAVKQVEAEIKHTFDYAKQQGADPYQLEHVLYRKTFPLWSKLTDNGERPLADYSLKSVKAELDLIHSGMYKIKKRGKDY